MKKDIQKITNRFDSEREIMNFDIVVHELIHEGVFHDTSIATLGAVLLSMNMIRIPW